MFSKQLFGISGIHHYIIMLIIGNKPYDKLDFERIVSCFDSNIRCNIQICKNGSNLHSHIFSNHLYDNFVIGEKSSSYISHVYENSDYTLGSMDQFINFFNKDNYRKIYCQDLENDKTTFNKLLGKLNCPYRFSGIPRVGYMAIYYAITQSTCNRVPHVFGFGLHNTNECQRPTYSNWAHVWDEHNINDELKILQWLHSNKYIDVSMCLLLDDVIPTFDCNDQFKITKHSLYMILNIYKKCQLYKNGKYYLIELK
jgi:hypothetical protein